MSAVLEIREVGKTILRGQKFWWQQLRQKGVGTSFTVQDLDLAGRDRLDNIRDFVRRLERAGFVECINQDEQLKRYDRKVYRIVKAPRVLPPLTRDGELGVQGRRRQHMWNYMRMASTFTKRSLADFASIEALPISVQTSGDYIKHLKAAGYLIVVTEDRPKHPAVYRLNPTRNTGPNPPMILRSSMVYDQNDDLLIEPIEAEATT